MFVLLVIEDKLKIMPHEFDRDTADVSTLMNKSIINNFVVFDSGFDSADK